MVDQKVAQAPGKQQSLSPPVHNAGNTEKKGVKGLHRIIYKGDKKPPEVLEVSGVLQTTEVNPAQAEHNKVVPKEAGEKKRPAFVEKSEMEIRNFGAKLFGSLGAVFGITPFAIYLLRGDVPLPVLGAAVLLALVCFGGVGYAMNTSRDSVAFAVIGLAEKWLSFMRDLIPALRGSGTQETTNAQLRVMEADIKALKTALETPK